MGGARWSKKLLPAAALTWLGSRPPRSVLRRDQQVVRRCPRASPTRLPAPPRTPAWTAPVLLWEGRAPSALQCPVHRRPQRGRTPRCWGRLPRSWPGRSPAPRSSLPAAAPFPSVPLGLLLTPRVPAAALRIPPCLRGAPPIHPQVTAPSPPAPSWSIFMQPLWVFLSSVALPIICLLYATVASF